MSTNQAIPELSRVVLTRDVPHLRLKAGDVGTVVHVYADGQEYSVEFCTLSGDTVAVVTVPAAQVRAIDGREVAQARRLAG